VVAGEGVEIICLAVAAQSETLESEFLMWRHKLSKMGHLLEKNSKSDKTKRRNPTAKRSFNALELF